MKPQKKILVVDDDAEMRSLLIDFLSTLGYLVEAVGSGAAALLLVVQAETSLPDLVISDIQMMPMDGVDLLKLLKAKCPDLPVVIISAFGACQCEEEVMAIGARKFLAKPVQLRELAAVVRNSLQG